MSGPPEEFSPDPALIQRVAAYVYGRVHPLNTISLPDIASYAQIDELVAAYVRRTLLGAELVDFDGQSVRVLGAGKSLYEQQCIPEMVFGLRYSKEKYRSAVVRIGVLHEGVPAAGSGFFVADPPNHIITNRHVIYRNTITHIEREGVELIAEGPLPTIFGPENLDLAAIKCALPPDVTPIRIDWTRGAARELDEVLVMSYPRVALLKTALYPATGKVGILGTLLTDGRESLMIPDIAAAGSSGGPVISVKGMVIGIVAHEAETQGAGVPRISSARFRVITSERYSPDRKRRGGRSRV